MSGGWLFRLCMGLGCLACACAAGGADWPQWGGRDGRNMVSDELPLPAVFKPGSKRPDGSGIDPGTTRNVKWTARLGSHTYGNPTVAGGRVFVGTNDYRLSRPGCKATRGGLVKCFDEATGRLLWQLVVPRYITTDKLFNFNELNLGVCSSPTVEGDRVYLVTSRGEVVCLDAAGLADGNDGPFTDEGQYVVGPGNKPLPAEPDDADIIWVFDMIGRLPVRPQDVASSSVLIHGEFLYVCTSNGVDKTHDKVTLPLAPSLIVLDKRTGRLVAADDEKIGTRLFHGLWSSPSLGRVGGKTLIFFGGGEGICYAFEAVEAAEKEPVKLKKVWSFDCNPPEYRFRNGRPIRYRDGDKRRKVGRNRKNDGTFVGPSEIIATPVFHEGRVYVAVGQDPLHGRGRGMLNCIDAAGTGDITATGKVWSYDALDRSLSTVSVADGLVYVADVIGSLHCLDAETGKPVWVERTGAETWASTFVADGKVYLPTKKALYVFAAGRKKKRLGEIYLGAPSYCTPVAANGVLYVASQNYLWAVRQGAKR